MSTWIHVGTLLDGTGAAPARDVHIVFDASSIRFVGRAGRQPPAECLRPGQSGPDFEFPEHTLLPGLTEAHAHFFLEGGELDPEKRAEYLKHSSSELLADAQRRAASLVKLGITAVRDTGDKRGVGLALSRLSRGHERPLMPFVDSPGAAIHHRGRYGSFMAEPIEDFPSPRACIEARVAAGADRIKLIATGIIDFARGRVTAKPQMGAAEVAEFVDAAKSLRRQTMAHASGETGIGNAIEGGVDSIEHGFFIQPEHLAQMRDRQTAWVPTFAPVQNQIDHADRMGWSEQIVGNLRAILEGHSARLAAAHALGVPIVAGSDAGSYGVAHGYGLLYELELMERAGLSPLAVIASATGAASSRFAFRESFGRIEPGCRSRFIVTRYSPLETVANLRKARTIFFDGQVFASINDHAKL